MSAIVDRISFNWANISNASQFYDCKVTALVRYAEFEWTEVTFHVLLPKRDYTISEFKAAALSKVKDAVAHLSRHRDFAELPGEEF